MSKRIIESDEEYDDEEEVYVPETKKIQPPKQVEVIKEVAVKPKI